MANSQSLIQAANLVHVDAVLDARLSGAAASRNDHVIGAQHLHAIRRVRDGRQVRRRFLRAEITHPYMLFLFDVTS